MARIPYELRDQAKEMYIVDGLTLDDVAKNTGISIAALKGYSADEDWSTQRKEYRDVLGGLRRKTVLLRGRLIEKALQSLDPQDVYAVSRLESATKRAGGQGAVAMPTARREIKTPEDAVKALQDAVEAKLNLVLSNPAEINLGSIKDVKKALEMIGDMKTNYATDEAPELDEDTREQDRAKLVDEVNRILGVR